MIVMLIGVSCKPKGEPEAPVDPVKPDTVPVDTIVPPPPTPVIDSTYLEDFTPFATTRNESYRPQLHYTPIKNWVNDPNGLIYRDGIWHMFYQYNPNGNQWGNMSWGHATSTDLVHWEEQPVALLRDALGDVFSGSSVLDFDNRAGFGENTIISFYTAAGSGGQQQAMAYSVDGIEWSREGVNNPIIPNPLHDDNCRDPKVFYDKERDQYVMALAHGWHMGAELWVSKNLTDWVLTDSVNYTFVGRPSFQWECPDLMYMPYADNPSEGEWVMIVSVNPGGPNIGSGTMYFLGDWDGEHFTIRDGKYPLWLDYGMDNYAGVTWSNAPDDRKILLGWMNNWEYSGDVPCHPWRSSFTLPREMKLVKRGDQTLISSLPVHEIDDYAGEWKEWPIKGDTLAAVGLQAAYEAEITIPTNENVSLTFRNSYQQKMSLYYSASSRSLMCTRGSNSGAEVKPTFRQTSTSAPTYAEGDQLTLRIIFDQSSMEVFTADGVAVMTWVCYPTIPYHQILCNGGTVLSCRTRSYESIWK